MKKREKGRKKPQQRLVDCLPIFISPKIIQQSDSEFLSYYWFLLLLIEAKNIKEQSSGSDTFSMGFGE
jgi:hypothetical protein